MSTTKNENENGLAPVARVIGILILVVVLISLSWHSHDVDKIWLGDHFNTRNPLDWLGLIFLIAAFAWITGIVTFFKGGDNIYPYGSRFKTFEGFGIGAALFIIAMLLIYLT